MLLPFAEGVAKLLLHCYLLRVHISEYADYN